MLKVWLERAPVIRSSFLLIKLLVVSVTQYSAAHNFTIYGRRTMESDFHWSTSVTTPLSLVNVQSVQADIQLFVV